MRVHGAYGGTRGHVRSYASPFPVVPTQNVVNSLHRSKFTLNINFWTFFTTTVGFRVFSSKVSFFSNYFIQILKKLPLITMVSEVG